LPQPVKTSCVAVVLNEAYSKDGVAPEVTLAEITAYSELDGPGATLDRVAEALGGPRAQAAAALLKRVDHGALDAVVGVYDKLDVRGRALAMEVATSESSCDKSAPLLARGMADSDREVARKGAGKLQRCGRAAVPALVRALKSDAGVRRVVAPLLASMA